MKLTWRNHKVVESSCQFDYRPIGPLIEVHINHDALAAMLARKLSRPGKGGRVRDISIAFGGAIVARRVSE